jgi:hypothetical protein
MARLKSLFQFAFSGKKRLPLLRLYLVDFNLRHLDRAKRRWYP